jgi:hypothetical protein
MVTHNNPSVPARERATANPPKPAAAAQEASTAPPAKFPPQDKGVTLTKAAKADALEATKSPSVDDSGHKADK